MRLLKVLSGQNPREIALRVLGKRSQGEFTEPSLDAALHGAAVSAPDRALCQELVYGTVRWQATLDWLIARKTPGRTQKQGLQHLLRLGLYQLFWLDRIPDHAAVNETVELARKSGFGPQAGFLNAVLRGYIREKEATRALLAQLKQTDPATGFSHPAWLVERWQRRWGAENTARLLELNNAPARTFARANTLKGDPGKLLEIWREENVEYDFARYDWTGENLVFVLKSHPPLTRLPSFQEGRFYVQDPSTLLAVQQLGPAPGQTVLDLCAAPGGKLTYSAQLMRNEGRLLAHDPNHARLKLVAENCARLGVTCVELVNSIQGGTVVPRQPRSLPAVLREFDRVLIDAPCSNTGVIRRRIDVRWRLGLEELGRLAEIQIGLLRQAAPLVKPGGVLVYSTCSLEPEENQKMVQRFLAEVPGFKLETERELLPFENSVDGAYVARLLRES